MAKIGHSQMQGQLSRLPQLHSPGGIRQGRVCWIAGADDGPRNPLSTGELKTNNQLAMGASNGGSVWKESVDNHTTTMAGNNKKWEGAADDEGSNKEGRDSKGDGDGDEGGGQQRGQGR